MDKLIEILMGLVLVVGTILIGYFSWIQNWTIAGFSIDFLHSAWILLKGGIFWMILMIGILLIVIGISELKE